MSTPDSLAAALRYVAAGFAPIPLLPMAKTPVYAGLFDEPPTTPEEVEKTWARAYRILHGKHPNVGLLLGASGLVLADADTLPEVESLRTLYFEHGAALPPPTSRTPGVREGDGAWKHRDGGHWVYRAPVGFDPNTTINTPLSADPEAQEVAHLQTGRRLMVVPPSIRAEGPYVPVSGQVLDLPDFLTAFLRAAAARASRDTGFDGSLAVSAEEFTWDAETDWVDLLPEGYEQRGAEHDGHVVYARPGGASGRSAVSHPAGCRHFPDQSVPAPLTLWTDQPGGYLDEFLATGRHSLTKLTAYARRWYRGDTRQARLALGLPTPTKQRVVEVRGRAADHLPEMPEPVEDVAPPEDVVVESSPEAQPEPLVEPSSEAEPVEREPVEAETAQAEPAEQAEPEPVREPEQEPAEPGPWTPTDIAGKLLDYLTSEAYTLLPEYHAMAASAEQNAGPWHRPGTYAAAAESQLLTARHLATPQIAEAVGLPVHRVYAVMRLLMPVLNEMGLTIRERTVHPTHDPRKYKSPPTHPADMTWAVFNTGIRARDEGAA